MTVVAEYEIVVGIAMMGLWAALVATGQVPEIPAGDREIWFHQPPKWSPPRSWSCPAWCCSVRPAGTVPLDP